VPIAADSARCTSRIRNRTAARLLRGKRAARARLSLLLALLTIGAVIGDGRSLGPPLTEPLAMAQAAPSFHGMLRYRDSSRWGQAVSLAVAQWNAANVGVTFKLATGTGCGEVCIVSNPSAIADAASHDTPSSRRAAFTSHVGIRPGEQVTITLGTPPPDPLAPSGADVRLIVHELGHALGVTHDGASCSVMNRDPQWLPDCHRVGWFVSNGRAMCGPTLRDARRAAHIWDGRGAAFDRYCTAATSRDEGREQTEYVRQNIAQITDRALLNVEEPTLNRPG
jgi:Dual-action HEIGH metallo-peptidase